MTLVVLTILAVLLATSVWPVFRWARTRGATPQGTGIILSVVGGAGGLVTVLATGEPLYDPAGFFLGSLGGLAYAIGAVLLILRCFAEGPAGPTVAASALARAIPAAASLLLPYAALPNTATIVGLSGAALALVLLVLAPAIRRGAAVPPRRTWSVMLAGGWLFAGLAGVAQLMSAWLSPHAVGATAFAQNLVCLLVLLIAASAAGAWPRPPDLVAGSLAGVVLGIVLPATYTALSQSPSAAGYVALTSLPAAIVVALGTFLWRERLTLWAWAGCAVGLASLVLLSLPGR